jgi:hypothetical protein
VDRTNAIAPPADIQIKEIARKSDRHTNIQTDKQVDRQTEKYAVKQACGQTERQTYRQRSILTDKFSVS